MTIAVVGRGEATSRTEAIWAVEYIWEMNGRRAMGYSNEAVDCVRAVECRGVMEHKGSQSKEAEGPARVDRMP